MAQKSKDLEVICYRLDKMTILEKTTLIRLGPYKQIMRYRVGFHSKR